MSSDAAPTEQSIPTSPSSIGATPYRRTTLVAPARPPRERGVLGLAVLSSLLSITGAVVGVRSRTSVAAVPAPPSSLRGAPVVLRAPRFALLEGVTRLARVDGNFCAATSQGATWCWGPAEEFIRSAAATASAYSVAMRRDVVVDRGTSPASRPPLPRGQGPASVAGHFEPVSFSSSDDGRDHYASSVHGEVWYWGDHSPERIPGFSQVVWVHARSSQLLTRPRSWRAVCGSHLNGTISCTETWEDNGDPTGYGILPRPSRPERVRRVPGVRDVTEVVGDEHTVCGITRARRVICWGSAFGTGVLLSRERPLAVPGLRGVTAVTGVRGETCALGRDGRVRCWGDAHRPAFTLDTFEPGPRAVPGLSEVVQLRGDGTVHCALRRDGTARCWDLTERYQPVFPGAASEIVVHEGSVYARLRDGSKWRWRTGGASAERVSGMSFDEASYHATNRSGPCSVSPDGVVVCDDSRAPHGLRGVRSLALDTTSGCALHEDGTVSCWGDNSDGQLGVRALHHSPFARVVIAPE